MEIDISASMALNSATGGGLLDVSLPVVIIHVTGLRHALGGDPEFNNNSINKKPRAHSGSRGRSFFDD